MDLEQLSEKWQSLTDEIERGYFYDESVFPELKRVVVAREVQNNPEPYTHLILPVGLSPEPLILSILILRPDRVHFLYTKDSEKYLDRIAQETNLRLSQIKTDLIDETNVPEIYQKVRDVYNEWGKPARIAVDISGGKKSMVGGCALAGAMIGATLFYIDSQFLYKYRKPKPGSEKLAILDNPYDVFGDIEFQRVQALYVEMDFVGAGRLLNDLQQKTSAPDYYEARALMCEAYAAWDDWRISEAFGLMQRCVNVIENHRRLKSDTPLNGQLPYLKTQLDVLERLNKAMLLDVSDPEQERQLLSSSDLYQPIIGSLRAGALRQEKRGKLDVAALMWYRLIELMSQRRLSGYGLLTSIPNYERTGIPAEELRKLYQAVRAESDKKAKPLTPLELPKEISLLDGYVLLQALNDAYRNNIHLGKIRSKIDARNKGIFAHGFKPLGQEDYDSFKSLAVELLESFGKLELTYKEDWENCSCIKVL